MDTVEDKQSGIIVGIDLGTSNSCIAIWRNNNLEIIPDEKGNRVIPSVVAFTNKSKYIGYEAKNQKDLNPENVFYEVKRLMGRKTTDENIKADMKFLTYGIDSDDNQNVMIKCDLTHRKKKYTPEEISSMILIKLKNMASEYLKTEITQAVITVPAYFNDSQRQATKDAAKIAGLECVRIINEPTAASLAYGLEKISFQSNKEHTIVVYDLGGGTLDVSLLTICQGVFEVHASVGNTHLGGADFDNQLVRHCLNTFKKRHKLDSLGDISNLSLQRLKRSCETAKKILSNSKTAIIAVKNFTDNKDLLIKITQEQFIHICKELFIMCMKPLDDIMKSCNFEKSQIDEIILVGGATRMPAIQTNIKNFFGKAPNCSMNPDEVVAAGAALQAYILSHKSDPFAESFVLLDIIPLSLGVETIGGVMNVVIPRNCVIPLSRKKKYAPDTDYVTDVNIQIYEGERQMTKDNFKVGEFVLEGLESMPRGYVEIDVTFAVDTNGIIHVTAEDLKNPENRKSIIVTGNKGRLSKDEIDELVAEAKILELNDKLQKEKKQMYYEIDDFLANIKINMNSSTHKLQDSDKELISNDITLIGNWLKEKPFYDRHKDEFKTVIDKIQKKYFSLIIKMTSDNNIKAGTVNTENNSTSVYNNEDDENGEISNIFYEELKNEEIGIGENSNQNTISELRELQETLVQLCYDINDIISSDVLIMKEEDKNEIKEYVEDTLIWAHVQQKITKHDYTLKIEEINNNCNNIINTYEKQNESLFASQNENGTNPRNELEQLCYTLKSSINCNIYALNQESVNILNKLIDGGLDMILQNDIELYSNDENKSEDYYPKYIEKIQEINDSCDILYKNINHEINPNITIISSEHDLSSISSEPDSSDGTSIETMMKNINSFQ